MYRIRNNNNSNHSNLYSYRFELKQGILADMPVFEKGEIDLLNLTLR